MVKVAINGFGRIGRVAFRAALEKYKDQVEVVAINTSGSMDINGWAHLLKYDTVYGNFKGKIGVMGESKGELGKLLIGGRSYPVLGEKDPLKIPWEKYGVEVVLECTGVFRKSVDVQAHIKAGAKKVIMSAPAKDDTPTYIIGVNVDQYKGEKIISNASCTTNCIAPIAKIMRDNFNVVKASMTTIHAYTADQELVDGSHKDLRRARSAAQNIIPTTTGAADAMAKVLPSLKGKFDGFAIRVPVACGSLADFSFVLDKSVRVEKINQVFEAASGDSRYQGIVAVTKDPIVSSDVVENSASAVVDLALTKVIDGNLVKIIAWYDNEWGYSCRLVEMANIISQNE